MKEGKDLIPKNLKINLINQKENIQEGEHVVLNINVNQKMIKKRETIRIEIILPQIVIIQKITLQKEIILEADLGNIQEEDLEIDQIVDHHMDHILLATHEVIPVPHIEHHPEEVAIQEAHLEIEIIILGKMKQNSTNLNM